MSDDRAAGSGPREIRLSPQLARVADGIRRGRSYDEIAADLGIGRRTVATYAERIAAKLENPEGLRPYLLIFAWTRHLRV